MIPGSAFIFVVLIIPSHVVLPTTTAKPCKTTALHTDSSSFLVHKNCTLSLRVTMSYSQNLTVPHLRVLNISSSKDVTSTYDHRLQRTRDPVRSPIFKL